MLDSDIDVAVVDVPLADEFGVELVRELHGADPSVPVLVLTDVQDRETHEALQEAGASEVLSKEISFESILAAVRRLEGTQTETDGVKVLFAYEDTHFAYGETLAGAVRALRPRAVVTIVRLRNLASEVKRLAPHLVVSNQPNTVDPGNRAAWYTLAYDPGDPSEVCLDGERSNLDNPGLEELVAIVDETENLVRTGQDPGGC